MFQNAYRHSIYLGRSGQMHTLPLKLATTQSVSQRCLSIGNILLRSATRSEARKKRGPANTKLATDSEGVVERRKAFGGNKKFKAVTVSHGCFGNDQLGVSEILPIKDVVYSGANPYHVEDKIIVKGTVVQLDVEPLLQKLKEKANIQNKENEQFLADALATLQNEKMVYGKVETRPGQMGEVKGRILFGDELEEFQKTLEILMQKPPPPRRKTTY